MNAQTTQKTESKQALWQSLVDDLMDKRQENIVKSAWNIIRAFFAPYHKPDEQDRPKLERKQLANLVAVAGETRTVAVIADFVRYQMGRDDKAKTWRAQITLDGKTTRLGEAVLQQVEDQLKADAAGIVNEAKKHLTPASAGDEVSFVWWMLVRRFAAYLEHAFVAEATDYEARSGKERSHERRS